MMESYLCVKGGLVSWLPELYRMVGGAENTNVMWRTKNSHNMDFGTFSKMTDLPRDTYEQILTRAFSAVANGKITAAWVWNRGEDAKMISRNATGTSIKSESTPSFLEDVYMVEEKTQSFLSHFVE
jgi:hypothetical protein